MPLVPIPPTSLQATNSVQELRPDSPYAIRRLFVALALMTIGARGMYVVVAVLPAVQAEFGATRADASLPYTLLMIGFGLGGILMGRLADRFGVMVPLLIGAVEPAGSAIVAASCGAAASGPSRSRTACSSASSAARPRSRR